MFAHEAGKYLSNIFVLPMSSRTKVNITFYNQGVDVENLWVQMGQD
jgi:hypothetical protein